MHTLLQLLFFVGVVSFVAAQCAEPAWMANVRLPAGSPFALSRVVGNLDSPDAMAVAPDGRLFVLERMSGTVRVISAAGELLPTPAFTLPVPAQRYRSAGARGIALDPEFATAGSSYVYVLYMRDNPRVQRIARYLMSGDVFVGSEEVLLDVPMTKENAGTAVNNGGSHNGGAIVFDSFKRLIVSIGDGWNPAAACCGGDPSQDLSVLIGKVLRIERNGTVPTDNPFVSTAGALPQIYAVGFRNPFSATLGLDGHVYINDVVWGKETVYRLVSGGNYGWRSIRDGVGVPQSAVHAASGLITGGVFFSGVSSSTMPAAGDYVLADWKNNRLRVLREGNLGGGRTDFAVGVENPAYVLECPATGDLYFLSTTYETACGGVYKLAASGVLRAPAPIISPAGGTFTAGVEVVIASPSGDAVYYTTDGSDPVVNGSQTSLLLPDSFVQLLDTGVTTIRAMVLKPGINTSVIVSATFVIELDETPPVPQRVTLLPDRSRVSLVFSEAVANAVATVLSHYTLQGGNGTVPTLLSAVHASGQPLVVLSFSELLHEDWGYQLVVQGVSDAVGNVMPSAMTLNVTALNGELVHLAFDDTSGQGTAADVLNAHNGQVCANVACSVLATGAWLPGTGGLNARSGALDLAQGVDHVDLGSWNLPADATGVSVSLWFKAHTFDVPGSSSQDGRLLSRATGVSDAQHFLMLSTMSGKVLRARVRAGGTTDTLVAQQGALNTDEWTLATLTYDNSVITLYKNGEVVGSAAHSVGGPLDIPAGSVPWWVGNNPTNGGRPLSAVLDDCRIYGRALTAAEVSNAFEYGLNKAPTVNAGVDQTMSFQPEEVFHFEAVIDDDGLPTVPGRLSVQWTVIEGNASAVSFDDANSWHTHPSFAGPGVYVFQIAVSDGLLQTLGTITGTITAPVVPTPAPEPTPSPPPVPAPPTTSPTQSPSAQPTPVPTPSALGEIVHIAFDESSGGTGTAVDYVGAHDGQVCADVPCASLVTSAWTSDGLNGTGALDLAQGVDHVDLGSWNLPADATGVSVSLWFKVHTFDVPGSSSQDGRLLSRATGVSTAQHFFMLSTLSGPVLRARVRAGGTTDTLVAQQGALDTGEWTLATLTYDNSVITLYKNGEVVGSATHSVGGPLDNPAGSVPWWVGNNPTDGGRRLSAFVSNLRMYKRALSAVQVADVHTRAINTRSPSPAPSSEPSSAPSTAPTTVPTAVPSAAPTAAPSAQPSTTPTSLPSAAPTALPTSTPTVVPTGIPTASPSLHPTVTPGTPSVAPTAAPTAAPTGIPSPNPTLLPTVHPSVSPTRAPSITPTAAPSTSPTALPTVLPTPAPSTAPGMPSLSPSSAPAAMPSTSPTPAVTALPTHAPTSVPTGNPTNGPTLAPSPVPVPLPPAFVPRVLASMRLRGWSLAALEQDAASLANFKLSLRRNIAGALQAGLYRVLIVSLRAGSIIAQVELLDAVDTDASTSAPRTGLALREQLRSMVVGRDSSLYSGAITNSTDPAFFTEDATPTDPSGSSASSSVPLVVGVVLAGVAVAAAAIWWHCKDAGDEEDIELQFTVGVGQALAHGNDTVVNDEDDPQGEPHTMGEEALEYTGETGLQHAD